MKELKMIAPKMGVTINDLRVILENSIESQNLPYRMEVANVQSINNSYNLESTTKDLSLTQLEEKINS